jgi:TonB family protein
VGRALILLAVTGLSVGCGALLTGQEHAEILGEFDDVLDYDTPPMLVQAVRPEYPEVAREVGAEGRVVLKALILEDGKLGGVEIMESPNPILTNEAITALKQSVFSPARKEGEPCCGTMVIPFIFDKDEGRAYGRTGMEVDRTGAPQEESYMPMDLPQGPEEEIRPAK